jgi:hypothetical protein
MADIGRVGHGGKAYHGDHPRDHNSRGSETHLHSHPHISGSARIKHEERILAEAFIDGFVAADDKVSFLRLANIPFEINSAEGTSLKLVDVEVNNAFQVGTASPGFASKELVYHPYPGSMVRERTEMIFVYVSMRERREINLLEHLGNLQRNGDS